LLGVAECQIISFEGCGAGAGWAESQDPMTTKNPDSAERIAGADRAVEQLVVGVCRGETRALARAISLVEDGAAEAGELLALCELALSGKGRAIRVGITGPAGAGKSTLVDGLTRELRRQGRRVGIVAVDPSSPFSGGAILGDRIRLADVAGDAGVYMRSMATRGHLGGLARATEDVLTVIEASGRDVLLIETTGVGQGEIEVVGLAGAVVVVLVPGMGDSVQSLKAGVLEIASVFVLNKADCEGIERLEGEIGEMLGLSAIVSAGKAAPAVLRTVATTGEGVGELLGVLDSLFAEEEHTSGAKAPRPFAVSMPGLKPRPTLEQRPVPALAPHPFPVDGAVLDHLGIAVRSIADSQGLYLALGASVSGIEEVAQERVRVMMLAVGEGRIELLEATEGDSAVGRFLAKRGEGLHHVALRVPDLQGVVERLKAQGVRLVSEAVQVGAGGHRYVFVHPASANGVLLELVESVGGEIGN
jgi:LAO/AO transport system kinase